MRPNGPPNPTQQPDRAQPPTAPHTRCSVLHIEAAVETTLHVQPIKDATIEGAVRAGLQLLRQPQALEAGLPV